METKLISSIAFGELLNSRIDKSPSWDQINRYRNKRTKFDNFLKEPLQLGMFIPCDSDGKPMEKPDNYDSFSSYTVGALANKLGGKPPEQWYKGCHKYEEALSRVYFEGFELSYDGTNIVSVDNNHIIVSFNKTHQSPTNERQIIEHLVSEVNLTHSKAKHLGVI